jgi:hypothetical protein
MSNKKAPKRLSPKERAEKIARKNAREDAPSPFEHYVAEDRGLDPMGIIGRDEPAVSPTKPEPPYSR